jgi:electron transfer flavoprotein alpha/beta subunit
MKLLICIKQVPEITDVKINTETGTLMREGIDSILNPFCEYAVEKALEVKEKNGDVETVAISMGPPQAKSALMRCLEMGVDRAILLADRAFAGADTWATALTLASSVKAIENDFDLILVGKQAIDGDTAQVGPELSELLGIPQITYGIDLDITSNKKRVRVTREVEGGKETLEAKFPCLVSVSRGPMIRSIPSFHDILAAREKPLKTVTSSDLGVSDNELGLQGSLTQVIKVFPPEMKKQGVIIKDSEPSYAAKQLIEFLKERNFI